MADDATRPRATSRISPDEALASVPLLAALHLRYEDGDVVLEPGPLYGNHFGAAYAVTVTAALEAAGALGLLQVADLTRWAPITAAFDVRFIRPAFSTVRARAHLEGGGAVVEGTSRPVTFEVRALCGRRHCAYGRISYVLKPWSSFEGDAVPETVRRLLERGRHKGLTQP